MKVYSAGHQNKSFTPKCVGNGTTLTAEKQRQTNYLEAADEVAPRKLLTSPLKLVLDLMAGI